MAFLMGEYIFHYPPPQVRVSCLSGTRRWTEPVWQLSDRPRHPFGSLIFELVSYLTLAGRGGSVSRRDHNPKTGKRAHLAWARKFEGKIKPIPSCSSGEGVWGRGASLREAASPPESSHATSFIRCHRWFPSFCGRRREVAAKPPQVSVSCLSGTRRWLSDRPRHPFGLSLIGLYQTKRWQVAAALSAAVTTTPRQENAPTSHGRASSKEKSSLFPATLRERGSGGEALLLEKRPLPQNLLPQHLFGREREGGCFSEEKHPPSHILFIFTHQTAYWSVRRS